MHLAMWVTYTNAQLDIVYLTIIITFVGQERGEAPMRVRAL